MAEVAITETVDDQDVLRVLKSLAAIRTERDGLRLDLEAIKRRQDELEVELRHALVERCKIQEQRDHYAARLVEMTTHFATIRQAVDAGERATAADIARGNGVQGQYAMPVSHGALNG